MTDDWNLFYGRLHRLRHFDDAFERRIAGHDALEQLAEGALDLAIDQVIDVEFIQTLRALELPCARAADHNLRPVFFDYRMFYDLEKLSRVQRNEVLAGNL